MEATLQPNDPLVARFRAGDREAFDAVMTAHRRQVYSVARRLLRHHEDADEATQQTFLRAWQARESFRSDARLSSWLISIALNVSRSMLARRKPERSVDELEERQDDGPGADQRLGGKQLQRRLRDAIETLPPRQREVVTLKLYEERTYREVAQLLELSEGAVKAHFHQAVSNLRRRMESPRVKEARR